MNKITTEHNEIIRKHFITIDRERVFILGECARIPEAVRQLQKNISETKADQSIISVDDKRDNLFQFAREIETCQVHSPPDITKARFLFPILEQMAQTAIKHGEKKQADNIHNSLVKIKTARENIILKNMGLPYFVVNERIKKGYIHPEMKEDMVQNANIALMRATDRYLVNKNVAFQTYACTYIDFFLRSIGERSDMVSMSKCYREIKTKIEQATQKYQLQNKTNNTPPDKWIEQETGLPRQSISNYKKTLLMANKNGRFSFINEESIAEISSDHESMEEMADKYLKIKQIAKAIRALDEKERAIIVARFGLDSGKVKTYRELARKYGMSIEGVRFIQNKAIKNLQKLVAAG